MSVDWVGQRRQQCWKWFVGVWWCWAAVGFDCASDWDEQAQAVGESMLLENERADVGRKERYNAQEDSPKLGVNKATTPSS